MTARTLGRSAHVQDYIDRFGYREPEILARLRAETAALPNAQMQIAPEQGAVLGLLVRLVGASRCLEIGTFTGYSSLAIALALPQGASLVCCDLSETYTATARRYWAEAGIEDRVDLRIGPALDTLDALLAAGGARSFDLAFIDADKTGYPAYWERCLSLVRAGGIIVLDNVLGGGAVANASGDGDEDVLAIRAVNETIAGDERVDYVLLGIADGMTVARKR
jgi:predicted O-methyltransferase YrrM